MCTFNTHIVHSERVCVRLFSCEHLFSVALSLLALHLSFSHPQSIFAIIMKCLELMFELLYLKLITPPPVVRTTTSATRRTKQIDAYIAYYCIYSTTSSVVVVVFFAQTEHIFRAKYIE